MHTLAQPAGNFFFRGTGLLTVLCKNQPRIPWSSFPGKACAGTSPGSVVEHCRFLDTRGGGRGGSK